MHRSDPTGSPPENSARGRETTRWGAISATAGRVALPIVVALFAAIGLAQSQGVQVQPFEVLPALAERGYNGRVIAQRLVDELSRISSTARTHANRQRYDSALLTALPNLEVSAAGFTLKGVFEQLRGAVFGAPTRVIGDITGDSGALNVVIRITGQEPRSIVGNADDIDGLLKRAAIEALKDLNPYVLAVYLLDADEAELARLLQSDWITKPNHPWAYQLWGNLLQRRGDVDAAVRQYRVVLEWPWPDAADPSLRDSRAHSLNNWGVILAAQGDQVEAIAKYKSALRFKGNYAAAFNNWGLSLYALGDLPGAQEKYLAAIRADPSSPEPHANLGELLMAERAFLKAADRFRTAILVAPTTGSGHCGLGLTLVAAGNGAEGRLHLNRCLELAPNGRWSDRARAALTRF